jgi:ATP-dependent RNA helicase DDX5/DBP2
LLSLLGALAFVERRTPRVPSLPGLGSSPRRAEPWELVSPLYSDGSLFLLCISYVLLARLDRLQAGHRPVMIATDVAARGLDVKDVKAVINYDFPGNVEDYVHRIGRTGRAGAKGTAYTFFTRKDAGKASSLVKIMEQAGQQIPPELLSMARGGGQVYGSTMQFSGGGGGGGYGGGGGGGYGSSSRDSYSSSRDTRDGKSDSRDKDRGYSRRRSRSRSKSRRSRSRSRSGKRSRSRSSDRRR